MNKPITRVLLVKGGDIIKQGHDFTIEFNLYDSEGVLVDLTGAVINYKIARSIGGLVSEGTASYMSLGRIALTVSDDLGNGTMRVEFTATKGGVVSKFPAEGFVDLKITPSLDDLGYTGVKVVTLEQFKKEIDTATKAAKAQADRAKVHADNIDNVMKNGPVQTVNGQTGAVTGLAKQSDLESTNRQLAEKAQQTELTNAISLIGERALKSDLTTKRDKGVSLMMVDLHTEVKTAMTGGAVAVVAVDGVATENLQIESAKFDKRTPNGNMAVLSTYQGALVSPNIDINAKTFTFTRPFVISWGKKRETFPAGSANKVVDLTNFFDGLPTLIYYNTKTYEITAKKATSTDVQYASESEVVLASVTVTNAGVSHINSTFNVTVNNKPYSNDGVPVYIISSPNGVDIDFINRKIKITTASIAHNSGVILIQNKTIDMHSNSWGTVYYNPGSDSLVSLPHTNTPPISYMKLFSYAENKYVTGIDNYSINGKPQTPLTINDQVSGSKDVFRITEDFQGMYKAVARTYRPYTYDEWFYLKHTEIYAMYEKLEADFPTYVTHEVMNTVTTPDGDMEIRRYKFKPIQPRDAIDKLPKVIIVAGIHGKEKMGQMSTFNMMHDICNHWREDDKLRFLRNNVEFIIFPSLNPWGTDNYERENHNGVDLNRNFPTNWWPTAIGPTYSGTHALSEIETQSVETTLQQNGDGALFIDFHNFFSVTGNDIIWVSCPTNKEKLIASNYIRSMTSFWKSGHTTVVQDDSVFGYVDGGSYGNGTAASNADANGIHGATLEVGEIFQVDSEAVRFDVITQKRSNEVVTNFILQHVKHLCM